VRHGYLLVKLNATNWRARNVSHASLNGPLLLVREDRWQEFPTRRTPDYTPIIGRLDQISTLRVSPSIPSTGEKEVAVEGIRAEKSQRSPEERPCGG